VCETSDGRLTRRFVDCTPNATPTPTKS
jgi:hypothetical protein